MMPDKIEGLSPTLAATLMGTDPTPAPAATPAPATPQPISTVTAPPTDGKPAQAAPVDGQPAVVKPGEPAKPPLPSPEQIAADAKKAEDDLKSALGMAESAEQKQQRLERDYAASSKEAKRLADESKKLTARLKEQGLDVAIVNGAVDFVANSKYSKDASEFEIKFKDLDEKSQELFVESPDKAIKLIVDRARQAFVRAAPTADRIVMPLSPERESEAVNFLVNDSYMTGEKKHADITENAGLIKQMLDAPSVNKALKEFRDQAPEMALEYLNLKVRAAKQFIKDSAAKVIEAQKIKEQKAASTPPFGPAGGGSAALGASDGSGDSMARQIARADIGWH
jgi:hypothetical protein